MVSILIFLVFVVVFDAFLIPISISRFFRRRLFESGFQLRFRRSIGHHHHFVFAVVGVFSNEKTTPIATTTTTEEFLSELSRRARGFPHVCVLCVFFTRRRKQKRALEKCGLKFPSHTHTKRHARNQLINLKNRAHVCISFVFGERRERHGPRFRRRSKKKRERKAFCRRR